MQGRVVILLGAIIGISALAAVGAFLFIKSAQEGAQSPSETSAQNPLPTSSQIPLVDSTADPDHDGLINAQEGLWGTNPNDPDTDGDGYTDGQEVANCHNPLVKAPNDKLSNCDPGKQLTSASSVATNGPADSFFPNLPDLSGSKINLTQAYANAVKDSDKSPVTLTNFINNQPIITALPPLNDKAISTTEDSRQTISSYMAVAGNIDSLSDQARLKIALNDFYNNKNTYGFTTLAQSVDTFQSTLKKQLVPSSAIAYDKLVLAYTELLSATLKQIANYTNDQVKALVAIRQLDAIDRQYYPQIAQARASLLPTVAPAP